jgi:hypothetical protein
MSNTMSAKDFFEGGLVNEAVYRFEITKASVETLKAQRDNPSKGVKKGDEFKKLLVTFQLEEDHKGTYNPTRKDRLIDSFPLYGKSLRRLASLYKAVTGSTPTVVTDEETGEDIIDFDAIADALAGGCAWGVVTHRNRQTETDDGTWEDTDEVDAKFGWSFAGSPEGVRVPKPVQERWNTAEEEEEEAAI